MTVSTVPDPLLQVGDLVRVTAHGHAANAVVSLASGNGQSLVLDFDGGLFGVAGGAYVGSMPVLWQPDGQWVEILNSTPITITRTRPS